MIARIRSFFLRLFHFNHVWKPCGPLRNYGVRHKSVGRYCDICGKYDWDWFDYGTPATAEDEFSKLNGER